MAIEDPIIVGVVIGTIVWLGQEFVKFIIFLCNKFRQTKKLKKTLADLHESLTPKERRDFNQYNTLFRFESKLEGLVRYATAVGHDKKADIHGVTKQIASVLEFYRRRHFEIPELASENDRVYLNLGPEDLELIQREIQSIEWLDTIIKNEAPGTSEAK